jgi:hypothetical protein
MSSTKSMILKVSSSSSPPFASYAATITGVDYSESTNSRYSDGPQIRIIGKCTRIAAPSLVDDPNGGDPEDWVGEELYAYANPKLGKNAKLRRWIEGIEGRELTEGAEYDLQQLVGRHVVMTFGPGSEGGRGCQTIVRDRDAGSADMARDLRRPAAAPAATRDRDAAPTQEATPRQIKYLWAVAKEASLSQDDVDGIADELFGRPAEQLTRREMSSLIEAVQAERPPAGSGSDTDEEPDF